MRSGIKAGAATPEFRLDTDGNLWTEKGPGGNRSLAWRDAATSAPVVSESDTMRITKTNHNVFLVRIFKYSRMMEIVQDGLNMLFKNT